MSEIQLDSPVPLYFQLKQILVEKIRRGELRPGDRIMTEAELCREYGISRTPVRQALTEMVREGYLTRTAGRGTFVTESSALKNQDGKNSLRVVFSDARWQELLESAVQFYNSAQPEKPLHLNIDIVHLWDIHDHLVSLVGNGTAPDISVLDSVWLAEFANQSHLVPVEEADPQWCEFLKLDTFPAMLEANRFQGQLWGIPICGDASVLWYRRDWLEAEKLSPPSTWEELVEVARHFQRPEVKERYGLGDYPFVFVGSRRGGETTTYQLLPFIWAAGGQLLDEGHILLASPQTASALTFLRSLIHEQRLAPPDVVDYTWDHSAQVFARGKAALALGGTYESFFIRETAGWDEAEFLERVGFVPVPAGPVGEPSTLVGGMNYVLYRQSASLQQSLGLLRMTVDPQILKPFCERTGQIPGRISVANALQREGKSFVSQTIPLIERARTRPSLPGFARVSRQFAALVEDCLSGRRPVEQALALTAERISAITDLPIAESEVFSRPDA